MQTSDRVVVVTGSTRGIGLEVARACVARGDRVVINGRARDTVDATVRLLSAAWGVAADVGRVGGAEAIVESALRACGRIDVWINNAGVDDPLSWDPVLDTNLTGAWRCARAFLGRFPHGRIVNVSSGAATVAIPGAAPYVASKAGLEGMMRALACDGVAITNVRLGAHQTELTRKRLSAADFQRLPGPDAAVEAILYAAGAPVELVAGRSLAAWRMGGEPLVEALLNQPLGSRPRALAQDPQLLALDRLDSPWGPSPQARLALARAAQTAPLERYPDPEHLALRSALGARFGLSPECVAPGAGISELLERTLRLFTQPGETVVCGDPTWPYFDQLCDRFSVRRRRVPYRLDGTLELGDIRERLVYLVSPSNPIGAPLDLRLLPRLGRQTTLVIDEAYAEYDDPLAPHAAELVAHTDARVIVLRTLSKLHGLASLRVGYALGSPQTIRLLERLQPPFCVGALAGAAAEAAVADEAHALAVFAANQQERTRVQARLDGAGVAWLPSRGPFFLVAAPQLHERCRRAGIAVPRGTWFDGRYSLFPVARPADDDRVLAALLSQENADAR